MTPYDEIGVGYAARRRADPRIAAAIHTALGEGRTLVNVGAGGGSYEPQDRKVVAVEPSAVMIRQRHPGSAPVVQAAAESLPLHDRAFDAAMALLTVHHWSDRARGLRELARVAERVVLLTWDPASDGFWLTRDYLPEVVDVDRRIMPDRALLEECLGPVAVAPLPIPHDCADGFLAAYWRRPELYLDPLARAAISTFSRVAGLEAGIARLGADLASGAWARRYGELADLTELDAGYRLVVAGAPMRERSSGRIASAGSASSAVTAK